MYFIIMSLLSRSSAFPSISCFRNRSACTASDGSCAAIKCITSSMVHSLVCPRGICGAGGVGTASAGAGADAVGVTTSVVLAAATAGTMVVGIVSGVEALIAGMAAGLAGLMEGEIEEEEDAGKGTANVWLVCGMIVLGGGVGTGAMFAVGVPWIAAGA